MTEQQMSVLAQIAEATKSDGYMFTSTFEHGELLKLGYVRVDLALTNGELGFKKKIATAITGQGSALLTKVATVSRKPYTRAGYSNKSKKERIMSQFPLESVEEIPAVDRRLSERVSKYPFEYMDVNQRFYVDGVDAVKKIQSAMGNANRKYSEDSLDENGNVIMKRGRKGDLIPERKQLRKFSCRSVRDEDGNVIGAHVYRVK